MVKTGSIIVIAVTALELLVSLVALITNFDKYLVSIAYGVVLLVLSISLLKNPASKCLSAITLGAALSSLFLNFGILNTIFMLLIIVGAILMLVGASNNRKLAQGGDV